jgi:hypothetical protein
MRTHCHCGAKLPEKPPPNTGNWGEWECPACLRTYCQDCEAPLNENDEGTCAACMEEANIRLLTLGR